MNIPSESQKNDESLEAIRRKYNLPENPVENNDPDFSETRPYEGIDNEEKVARYTSKKMWLEISRNRETIPRLIEKTEKHPDDQSETINRMLTYLVASAYRETRLDPDIEAQLANTIGILEEFLLEEDEEGNKLHDLVDISHGNGNEFERAALATVLALECAQKPYANEVVFEGVRFSRYSSDFHSHRDRMEYLVQQGWKYGYIGDELPKLFLLHTRTSEDEKTRYLQLQEENITTARQYVRESHEARKGSFTLREIRDIEQLLLQGLVPEGNERMLRVNRATAGGRLETVIPDFIRPEVDKCTKGMEAIVQNKPEEIVPEDAAIQVAIFIAAWDIIHPTRDANGRIETLVAEDYLQSLLGLPVSLEIPREEAKMYADAISSAIVHYDTKYKLIQLLDSEITDGEWVSGEEAENFQKLGRFILEHTSER